MKTEQQIQALLAERGGTAVSGGLVKIDAEGAEALSVGGIGSPETYVGYDRASHFASPGGLRHDISFAYLLPPDLQLNQWGFSGTWTDRAEVASLDAAPGRIAYRFHARDLHLVVGPSVDGKPVRFRVTLDGKAPGADHGVDIGISGTGTVTEHRLYQLIRQRNAVGDHTFEIEFLDAGVQVFAFTFG